MIFLHVVHQVKLCTGKEVPRGTIYAVPCNSNNLETFRKFSKSCTHIMLALAGGAICCNCHNVSIDTHSESDLLLESDLIHQRTHFNTKLLLSSDIRLSQRYFSVVTFEKCLDEVAGKDKRQRKWDADVLSFALTLWIASPVAYMILHEFMHRPSERLLQMYKNGSGENLVINHNIIQWMYGECHRTGTEEEGGGG